MLVQGSSTPLYGRRPMPLCCSSSSSSSSHTKILTKCSNRVSKVAVSLLAAAALITSGAPALQLSPQDETLSNIPQTLSGECASPNNCKKPRIQRPKSRKAESCTSKCVTTCIQGGDGSPGTGPFNIRRPLVVFKEGFRSRKYW